MVQRTQVKQTRKKFSGETSPYWEWVIQRLNNNQENNKNNQNEAESILANPDLLSESEGYFPRTSKETQETVDLIREALYKLSPKQFAVIEKLSEGKSMRKTAEELHIHLSTVSHHLNRARKKIQEYVVQNR